MSTLKVYMYLDFSHCSGMLSLSGIIYTSEERIYSICMYIHILDPQVWRHCCRPWGLVWHEQVKLTWVSKAGAVPRVLHPKYRPEVLFVLCVCLRCCEWSVFQKMSWCAYGCCVVCVFVRVSVCLCVPCLDVYLTFCFWKSLRVLHTCIKITHMLDGVRCPHSLCFYILTLMHPKSDLHSFNVCTFLRISSILVYFHTAIREISH